MAFLMGAQAQGNGVKVPKKASTPEAYVLYDEVEDDYFDGYYNGRLTFYYDTYRSSREGETFDLNEGYSTPDWHDKMRNVSKVVFNPSFADARPKSTFEWFSCFFDTDEGWEIYSTLYEIEGMEYLNTSQVETMSWMFYGCFVFKGADFSHFDTRNVVDMDYMFNYCNALTVLDLSSFDTSNVLEMVGMFEDCSKLSTIYVGDGWTVDHLDADATEDMFDYCESLVGGMGTSYDPEHVDGEYAHVDGGSDNPGYLTYSLGNVVSYHFKVGGVEVTNLNAHNIAGSSIKGKVSYDDATKTLTLGKAKGEMVDYLLYEGKIYTISHFSVSTFTETEALSTAARYPVATPLNSLESVTVEAAGKEPVRYGLVRIDEEQQEDGTEKGERNVRCLRNGEEIPYETFAAAYERMLTVTVSGKIPEGFVPQEAHTKYTFRTVSGGTHTVELCDFDGIHDAVKMDGYCMFYLIKDGMTELP